MCREPAPVRYGVTRQAVEVVPFVVGEAQGASQRPQHLR